MTCKDIGPDERVSETLVFDSALTRLIARENFIAFIGREIFKSYIIHQQFLAYSTNRIFNKVCTTDVHRNVSLTPFSKLASIRQNTVFIAHRCEHDTTGLPSVMKLEQPAVNYLFSLQYRIRL